jgi:hypothetical protein
MLPPPDANLSTLFAVTDAAYAAIDTDAGMAAFKAGSGANATSTPSVDLARLEVRLPLPKAASMWLFRSLQRPYSLDDLRGLSAVPTALAAATGLEQYKLFFTPINLRGGVRSVVIDDLLMTVTATPVLKSVQACGSWMHLIDTYLWPASAYNSSLIPDPVPSGAYIQAAPGTGPVPGNGPADTPIPSAASLFNAAAAAGMPVPFAAARRRRAVAAGAGSAAVVVLVAACAGVGLAARRAWARSRDAAERAGCERGLAIGLSNATASSTGGNGGPWPELHQSGEGKRSGGDGVALSGALAALAAARAGDGPDGDGDDGPGTGGLAVGDTLADALAGRPSGGGPRTGASTLPSGGGVSRSTPGGRTGGAGASGATPAGRPSTDRDAPAPDDWAQCLAAELGPSGWALDGSSVRILTTPDGRPRRLGEGGFGTVYLADMHGTQVAVKLLSTQQPREVRRFIGEASILKELRHTNVVQFLGAYCGTGGQVALVTEYLPRGDLYRLLGRDFDRQYAWWRRGRGVALDIARGVVYMHTRSPPIIHLDIKSANVLLARDFTAKVADVGLAKVLSRADTKVSLEGTFDYAAPELLSGERVSQAADVYSLSVVLWELVRFLFFTFLFFRGGCVWWWFGGGGAPSHRRRPPAAASPRHAPHHALHTHNTSHSQHTKKNIN